MPRVSVEPLLTPLVVLAVAALLPVGTARLLEWVYATTGDGGRAHRRALRAVGVGEAALCAYLGTRAVGPGLVPHVGHPGALAFGAVAGVVCAGVILRAWRATHAARPDGEASTKTGRARGWVLGGVAGACLVAAPIALLRVTDVRADEIHRVSLAGATWRLRFDPWDGEALVALGWHLRRAGDLEAAGDACELAARAGADAQARLVLVAELRAAAEDCEGARVAFQQSLEAQAERVFSRADAHLELGRYDLPPTLVTECELTVGDAVGGDADAPVPVGRP
jgi:hypothetical protein